MLISLFLEDGEPVIVKVDNDGIQVTDSFELIGTGAYLARTILDERNYDSGLGLETAMYIVYEAKRFSETAEGVNKTTHIMVHHQSSKEPPTEDDPGAALSVITRTGLGFLADSYKRVGLQPVLIDQLPSIASTHRENWSNVSPRNQ